jgi:hypothetical protein
MSNGLSALLFLVIGITQGQSADRHKIIEPRDVIALEAGTWDAVITIPPRTPGGMPTTATGIQLNEPRSDGLWMLNRMSVNGGPYQGTGIWGFDRQTGRYSGSWVDNGTVRIRMDDGHWDPDTNTMTWTSEFERRDGRKVKMRATSTFSGQTRTYRSFAVTEDGDVLLSTVIFTRRMEIVSE